jgi:hypothetical protein
MSRLEEKHQREWEELKRRQRKELQRVQKGAASDSEDKESDSDSDSDDDSGSHGSSRPVKKPPCKPPRSAVFFDEEEERGKAKKQVAWQEKDGRKGSRKERSEDDQSDREQGDGARQKADRQKTDRRFKKAKESYDKMLARVPTRKPLGLADLMDKAEPKKPSNAFFLFKKEIEPHLVAQGVLDKAWDVTQRSKVVAQQWKNCTQEMKDKFERRYKVNLVAYKEACELYEAKVWVAEQIQDYIRDFQRGALREKELNEHCREFFRQYDEMSQADKDQLKRSRKRRVRKVKKVINKVSLD